MPVMEAEKEKSTVMVDEEEILKMSQRIQQNSREDDLFSKKLDDYLNSNEKTSEPLTIGRTPNSLSISGAKSELNIVITPSTISKCMAEADEHYHGHGLSAEIMKQLPAEIRNPAMIFKGNKDNSLVAITELKDKENREIMIAVALSDKKGFKEVNRISSAYGRNNMTNFLQAQMEQGNLIAANKEKANKMLRSAGLQLPLENTFISFDNSIAYSDKNVNTILPEKGEEKAENLLPILNTKYRSHLNQIDNFNEKKAVCTDKIDYRQGKIDKLGLKADRLEQTNRMLKSMFADTKLFAPVNMIMQRNANKIKQIREERIPKHVRKIDVQNTKLEKLNHKIDVKQCKADKLLNFSNLIKSFGVLNKDERHKQFTTALDGLHNASERSLQFKLKKCDTKLEKLNEMYLNTNSSVEKLDMSKQISDLNSRRSTLSDKLVKLQGISQPFAEQPVETMDKLMQHTETNINKAMSSEKLDINNLAENICVNNAEYLKNAEMAMEDDYNSIDGIINNGKREDVVLEDKNHDEMLKQAGEQAERMSEDEKKNFLNNADRGGAAAPIDIALNEVLSAELHKKAAELTSDNWIDTLVDTGKAEIKEDGSFKINADYYKHIPKEDKVIQQFSSKTANDIMSELVDKGIEFSAVSRANDVVAITVDRKDENVLNSLFDKDINLITQPEKSNTEHQNVRTGKQISLNKETGNLDVKPRNEQNIEKMSELEQLQYTVDTDIQLYGKVQSETLSAFRENGYDVVNNEAVKLAEPQTSIPLKVNPQYYSSLTKENRSISMQPQDIATKIMKDLDTKGIPYSAVSRKNDMVAITVSKENAQSFDNAEVSAKNQHAAEYINTDFYKSLDKSERFTQRMPETQAKQAEVELKRKGIGYSAVMNGEKSAITIDKKDTNRATFSRKQLHNSASHLKDNREHSENKTKNKNRSEEL